MKPHCTLEFAALALLVAMPVIAWAAFKPIRILVPTLNGVTCIAQVCVEEPPKLELAQLLQRNAVAAVRHKMVPLAAAPLTVFCLTRACYKSFGGGMERGATLFNPEFSLDSKPKVRMQA